MYISEYYLERQNHAIVNKIQVFYATFSNVSVISLGV
jgi:hypothetical protein